MNKQNEPLWDGDGEDAEDAFDRKLDEWEQRDWLTWLSENFSFEGFDEGTEGTEGTGRGRAKIEGKGKEMSGIIVFHQGGESGFKAKKGK